VNRSELITCQVSLMAWAVIEVAVVVNLVLYHAAIYGFEPSR
jgi:hypothetical protein